MKEAEKLPELLEERDKLKDRIAEIDQKIIEHLSLPNSAYRKELEKKYLDTYWVCQRSTGSQTWNIYYHIKKVTDLHCALDHSVVCSVIYDSFELLPFHEFTITIGRECTAAMIYAGSEKISKSRYFKEKNMLMRKLEKL